MKKLFTILLLVITVSVNAQKDTTEVADSIPLVTIKQINDVLTEMRKLMTIEEYNLYMELRHWLQAKINDAIAERKKKKPK